MLITAFFKYVKWTVLIVILLNILVVLSLFLWKMSSFTGSEVDIIDDIFLDWIRNM